MTYKIYNRVFNGNYNDIVFETVEAQPDIKTVLWFSIGENQELIAHVGPLDRVAIAHRGVLSTKFRQTQYELFKQYFNLTDNDDVPYKYLHTTKSQLAV